MARKINFIALLEQLREWFDTPTPQYQDFDAWRYQCYADLHAGRIQNLPLKTWWPRYSDEVRLQTLAQAYTLEERRFALNGMPPSNECALVFLYQQFHAGIAELAISKRVEEFAVELSHR